MNKNIYQKIKNLRIARGFSQQQMANRMHIVVSAYGKIERGLTRLTIERLDEIAGILQTPISDLLNHTVDSKLEDAEKYLHKKISDLKNEIEKRNASAIKKNELLKTEINDVVIAKFGLEVSKSKPAFLPVETPAKEIKPEKPGDSSAIYKKYKSVGSLAITQLDSYCKAFEMMMKDKHLYLFFEKGFIENDLLEKLWSNYQKNSVAVKI